MFEQPTLREVVGWFLEHHVSTMRRGSQSTYKSILQDFVAHLPECPTAANLSEYLAGAVNEGRLSPSTANLRKRILGRCLKVAQTKWPLLANITIATPNLSVPGVLKPRALAAPELTFPRLIAVMPDWTAKAFLLGQEYMGLRVGEMRGLEPRHVDYARGSVSVFQQRAVDSLEPMALKTDTCAATLPAHPDFLHALREAAREKIRSTRGGGTGRYIREAAKRYLFPYYRRDQDALIERCFQVSPGDFCVGNGWHVFRHTFCTGLVESGMPVHKAQLLMRHRHLNTTANYYAKVRGREIPGEDLRALWGSARQARAGVVDAECRRETLTAQSFTGTKAKGAKEG